jgi:hypothetical protein
MLFLGSTASFMSASCMLQVLNVFIGDGAGLHGFKTCKTAETCVSVAGFEVNVHSV